MKKLLFFLLGIIFMFGNGFNLDAMLKDEKIDPYFDTTKYNTSIIYTISEENATKEQVQDLVVKIEERLPLYYTESEVLVRDGKEIIINVDSYEDTTEIMDEIMKPAVIEFLSEAEYQNKENGDAYEILLDGFDIEDARAEAFLNGMGMREHAVYLQLTESATLEFEEYTQNNIGGIIYVLYDGEIITAPYIGTCISDGVVLINGISSYEEANQIASFIRIGQLPLTLELKEIKENEGK